MVRPSSSAAPWNKASLPSPWHRESAASAPSGRSRSAPSCGDVFLLGNQVRAQQRERAQAAVQRCRVARDVIAVGQESGARPRGPANRRRDGSNAGRRENTAQRPPAPPPRRYGQSPARGKTSRAEYRCRAWRDHQAAEARGKRFVGAGQQEIGMADPRRQAARGDIGPPGEGVPTAKPAPPSVQEIARIFARRRLRRLRENRATTRTRAAPPPRLAPPQRHPTVAG